MKLVFSFFFRCSSVLTVFLLVSSSRGAVTTVNDSGPGSLREALVETPDGGIVTFADNLSGQTIYMTNGQLTISKSLSIIASNLPLGIRIDARRLSRVMEITASNTVTLDSLTITNGYTSGDYPADRGGGIFINSGVALIANRITISGNSAFNCGGVFVSGSSISLNHSTVSGNSATSGCGGISAENFSTVNVNYSTVSSNAAMFYGGGLSATIFSSLNVNQSTISGNSARLGGGIYTFFSTLVLEGATLSGNSSTTGDNIYNDRGTTTMTNSIVAGNGSNNIFGPYSSDHSFTNGNALLASLGFYGGPTQTMPPLPGSPAIDMGASTGIAADQRGFARVVGTAPDLGSVEAFPFSNLTPIDTDDDGLDDRLELAYFERLDIANSTTDFDGDGSSDRDEFANMTDPRNAGDHLRISSFAIAAGFHAVTSPLFDITVRTFPGLSYTLQTNGALNAFSDIPGSAFIATNTAHTMQIQLSPSLGFLRAKRN